MRDYCVIDDKGWIKEINGRDAVPVGGVSISPDLAHKLKRCQLIMFWDGAKFCQVKNPKDVWKRVRISGFHGSIAASEYKNLLGNLDPSFPDVPGGTVFDVYPNEKKTLYPDFECELKPGLKVELSGEDDLDLWEKAMIDSGLYTPEEALFSAQSWLSDPMTWPVKVTWKGRPLQLELHQLGSGNTLIGGFTAHLDRGRPRWFWKQAALPVLKALYGYGFETINEQVRIDKPHYAKFLSDTYGHEILRASDKYINVRLNIKEAIGKIGPWPTRKTLGADWKWEKDGVLVREAMEADLPSISKAIEDSWGDNPRKQLAIRNFESQWALDFASILLSINDGKIIEARSFRERNDKSISLRTNILRTAINEKTNIAMAGTLEWQKAVGYTETSFIIETKLFERVKDQWLARGWKVYNQTPEITECRKSL